MLADITISIDEAFDNLSPQKKQVFVEYAFFGLSADQRANLLARVLKHNYLINKLKDYGYKIEKTENKTANSRDKI